MKITMFPAALLAGLTILLPPETYAQEHRELATGRPDAIVDLRTRDGTALVEATWKFHPADVVPTEFRAPGRSDADSLALYPTGRPIEARTLEPRAGGAGFDDSSWEALDPATLETRRGAGLLSFVWYRLHFTVPARIGRFDAAGSTIVFELVADDYSEIRVNGQLHKALGQSGGGVASGWNARNRVFLTDDAQPGQRFELAILCANAPFADLPENYIWLRSATLDFYHTFPKRPDWQHVGQIVALDTTLRTVIDPAARVEKLADGFQFIEGPVWHRDGYLLFSDPNTNVIYRYEPLSQNVSVYLTKSGYAGADIGEYGQPGSNGLALDADGRLVVCQHGNRRVVRHEKKGPVTVLADRFEGRRLNSPNDLVIRRDGSVYFTDPPYGLPQNYADPRKELTHQGVYRIANGRVELLTTALGGPNGLAFSPDERYLYVANWDIRDIRRTKTLWRFDVRPDGRLANGTVFFDFGFIEGDEALDGVKVDRAGNVFVSIPGGIAILSPAGRYLGRIVGPERPANLAWGDADGKTLYLTAHTGLYKVRTLNGGAFPTAPHR